MIYREKPDEALFLKKQVPHIFFFPADSQESDYFQIVLKSGKIQKLRNQYESFSSPLEKNKEIEITYYSSNQYRDEHKEKAQSLFLLQDSRGNLYNISPQSQMKIYQDWENMKIQTIIGEYQKINENTNTTSEIITLIENYKKNKEYFFLKKLPPLFQNNKKFQNLSYHYTKQLAQVIPFYQKNAEYAEFYFSLFSVKKQWNTTKEKTMENIDLTSYFFKNKILWKSQTLSSSETSFLTIFQKLLRRIF